MISFGTAYTFSMARAWEPSQGSHQYALAEASFARRSQSAGGYGNPPRVPIYNHRAVAPMVEQRSPKPRVVGSSPACPAAVHNPQSGTAGLGA